VKQAPLPNLKPVKPGDPISAKHYNAMVEAINRLSRIVTGPDMSYDSRLIFAELAEDLDENERNAELNKLAYDETISAGTDAVDVSGSTQGRTADVHEGVWLDGERHLWFWWRAIGRWIPIPGMQLHIGKMAATLSQGGSALMDIWDVNDAGAWVDSGLSVTVYDWCLAAGQTIETGKKVIAFQHRQTRRWIVLAAEC